MKSRSKAVLAWLGRFAGILCVAAGIDWALTGLNSPWWVKAGLVFAGTKVGADMAVALYRRKGKHLYFEDYLLELFLFMLAATVGILGVAAANIYLGGAVWVPLLAAALVLIWL
ncbi:MAG: hypothetical protein GX090_03190 [Firmicutes bacterium]|nr:hypothetical protein [Bacillota bacterium]HOB34770.1 hypothetical protein [Bacillota bacterium]HPZ91018.1 hypothetical protein [Bacillota bacterium]HQE02047.1 hypothetical protein [Bacillota bacterium]